MILRQRFGSKCKKDNAMKILITRSPNPGNRFDCQEVEHRDLSPYVGLADKQPEIRRALSVADAIIAKTITYEFWTRATLKGMDLILGEDEEIPIFMWSDALAYRRRRMNPPVAKPYVPYVPPEPPNLTRELFKTWEDCRVFEGDMFAGAYKCPGWQIVEMIHTPDFTFRFVLDGVMLRCIDVFEDEKFEGENGSWALRAELADLSHVPIEDRLYLGLGDVPPWRQMQGINTPGVTMSNIPGARAAIDIFKASRQ
jgi:hypothetical protein